MAATFSTEPSGCRSSHVDIYEYKKKKYQACLDCGKEEELKE